MSYRWKGRWLDDLLPWRTRQRARNDLLGQKIGALASDIARRHREEAAIHQPDCLTQQTLCPSAFCSCGGDEVGHGLWLHHLEQRRQRRG